MVFTNKHTESLIKQFPYFANSSALKDTIALFDAPSSDEVNEHIIFIGLTRYVIDELIKNVPLITDEEKGIYLYIESMLVKLDQFKDENSDEFLFSNAICVCFLENLLNTASWQEIQYDRFIPYLGEKCKEYCKAWDQFTDVRSPGLWSDEEWEKSPKGKDSLTSSGE